MCCMHALLSHTTDGEFEGNPSWHLQLVTSFSLEEMNDTSNEGLRNQDQLVLKLLFYFVSVRGAQVALVKHSQTPTQPTPARAGLLFFQICQGENMPMLLPFETLSTSKSRN
jgi:hypothetical protein